MLNKIRVEELYSELNGQLCRFVNLIVRDIDVSQDIVQDAFVKLIEYSEKYNIADFNLKSFLYKVCKNLTINYLKKSNYFEFLPIDVVDNNFRFSSIHSPVESNNISHIFESILIQLSVSHNLIFQLKLAYHLNNNQIAREMGISERTVRRKLIESKKYIKANSTLQQFII